jgi:2'-5' RNA ligase
VSSPASVAPSERLRLFCALRLPEDVLDRLEEWGREHLRGRVVTRENLHVTLAFLGSRPRGDLGPVGTALRKAAAGVGEIRFTPVRYRETRSVGMLVLADETDAAGVLARDLHERLRRLGVYEPEQRPWLAHVTVLRFRRPERLEPPLPELGAFSPSDAAVYHSVLRSTGARYEVLDSFALGG